MDFPANSKNPRPGPDEQPEPTPSEDQTIVEPVAIEGAVIRRKKPLGRRFVETFFSGESPKSVMGYVFSTVLMPAAKDMLRDGAHEALDRILYSRSDDRGGSRRGSRNGTSPYISYGRASSPAARREDPRERPSLSSRARAMHDFDEIVLPTRAEASEVIERLYDVLNRYEEVKVSDLYRILEITPSYTDDKWGWKDLRGTQPRKVREGYLLDLPRPEPL